VDVTDRFREGFGRIVDPGDKKSFLCVLDTNDPCLTQMRDEAGEGDPTSSVHMKMAFVSDVILVYIVCLDTLSSTANEASNSQQTILKSQKYHEQCDSKTTYVLDNKATNSLWNCIE
jgi:hypothetical protein